MALVASWQFEEGTGGTSADSSGNGHTLTIDEAITDWITGKIGSFALQHLSDGAGHGLAASFTAITLGTAYSITMWVWWLNTGSDDGILIAGNAGHYGFYLDGSAIYHSAGSGNFVSVSYTPEASWHHLAVTRSGGTVRFYRDGVALGAAQTLGTAGTALTVRGIGSYPFIPEDGAAKSKLDDIRLYDTTLTAAEIAAIAGVGGRFPALLIAP